MIQSAITNQKLTYISYKSISKNEITEREIEPLGVYLTPIAWVVVAYCRLRNDIREFRLDHIQELKLLPAKFDSRKFDLQKYFQR